MMRYFRWVFPLLLLSLRGAPAPRPPAPVAPLAEAVESGVLIGQVQDSAGPVEGAEVQFKGQARTVRTDAEGRFQLPWSPGSGQRVTASKPGYFIAGAAVDAAPLVLTLVRLPDQDCTTYAWVDPAADRSQRHNCANCHGEIFREWSASAHARSANGRRFRNLYDGSDWHGRRNMGWSLLAEHKDGAGVCTACHAPTVAHEDPAYFDLRQATGVAAKGVHCDYCHKIADADTKNIPLTHGRFGLTLLRPSEGQLFFGPLADVDRGEDVASPLYRQSRYCASCHEGTVFGVHVYSTYSEWLDSPARREGKQCQTCHMAPTGQMTNMAPGKGGIPRDPRTLGNHRFFAGSQADMLKQCLHVGVVLTPANDGLRAEVEVRADQVGHRVPTGFVDRNLLLSVEALDHAGKVLAALSGPKLPGAAGAGFASQPGRLYAKLLKDFDNHSPAPFWRAVANVADTRLVPGQVDRSSFTFPAATERVRVRLIYRRFWNEVARSKSWPDNETVVLDQVVSVVPGKESRWSGP